METGGNPTENFASVRSLFLAEVLNSPTNGYAQFLSASTPGQSRGTASFSKDLDFEVAEMADPVLSVAILGGKTETTVQNAVLVALVELK